MIFDFNSPENKISIQSVGGKYYHLYFLNKIEGINVPQAFCISSLDYNKMNVERRITPQKKYAVRSSYVQEDLPGKSAAGIFESFLNIKGYHLIHEKIRECFAAVNSKRAIAYHKSSNKEKKMCVIVQEMVQPELSGVLFTRNPMSAVEEYYIQITKGSGDKLVSGMVNPESFILSKDEKPDNALLKALLYAASQIEYHFKTDLDIEWAWKENQLYILQARPISFNADITDSSFYWTRANIGEIIPNPLTPLAWSIFKDVIFNAYRVKYYSLLDRFFTNFIHLIPRKSPKVKSPKMFNGYLYLNMETIFKVFGSEPWVTTKILEAALGFNIPATFYNYKPDYKDKIYSLIKKWIYILELIFPWISMERRILKFVQTQIFKIEKKKTNHNLDRIVKFIFGWHMAVTERSFSHLGFIYYYLKKFKKVEYPVSEIITNLDNYNYSLPHKSNNQKTIQDNYLGSVSASNPNSFNDFEIAISNKNDEKNIIIDSDNLDRSLPSNYNDQNKNESKFYRYLLGKLKTSIMRREQLKSILIREYRKYRSFYLKKAESFVNANQIRKIDDIFYLKKEEIDNRLNTKMDFDDLIVRRKKIHNEQCSNTVPVNFFGVENILNLDIHNSPNAALKGIGCSRGIVSGNVKIMVTPNQTLKINDNDILITKFADPGWTPYLLKSKGMVTEIGGILSHLATIAREHNIPLIVGVENATQFLKNSHEIKIDGQTGVIQVIN